MQLVSYCCHRPIVKGYKVEHPLNDRYYINFNIDVCEGCGLESYETAEQCEICGEIGCAEDCE